VIRTLGRYELLEKIGHGGIGVVYRAMETETQRAVKASIVF
jgi:serine/threonine protein kinase